MRIMQRLTWPGLIYIGICWLACIAFLEYGKHQRHKDTLALQFRLESLESYRKHLLEQKNRLTLRINSEEDPEWMTLTLMNTLGLVPKGYVKVYFEET